MERQITHTFYWPEIGGILKGFDDYVSLLQICTKKQDLVQGRYGHANMIIDNMKHQILDNALLNMYAKCGNIDDAWCIFDKMCEKDVFSWTNMISGCVTNGFPSQALTLFWKMGRACVEPNNVTFSCLLKGCSILGSFDIGRLIHKYIVDIGFEMHVFVGSALIDMYVKCGSIHDAYKVFNQMQDRNIVSWSTMISGFVQCKHGHIASTLLSDMLLEGLQPNDVTFISILKGCALMVDLEQGRCIHFLVKESRHHEDIFVETNIIDMYAKCGSLLDAREVFNKMAEHTVITFSTMLSAYIQSGEVVEALKLFKQMRSMKLKPDKITFVSMLKGLAMIDDLEEGRRIHDLIRRYGYESDKFVGSALLDMYAKCMSVENVQKVFDQLEEQDVVSWSSIIAAYAQCNLENQALLCFDRMVCEGILPTSYTFSSILKACSVLQHLMEGKQIHSVIIGTEHESDTFIASSLINMYVKCDCIIMAEQAFYKSPKQKLAPWNAMIAGFLQHNLVSKALMSLQQMKVEGILPNAITVVSVLNACSMLQDVELGKQFHLYAMDNELESSVYVQNSLIDMYAKCGRLEVAESLFGGSLHRNVATWNGMISSYVRFEYAEDALKLFQRMVEECIIPDEITFSSLFKACANLAILQKACRFHALMRESKFRQDPDLCNSMINMYGKSGDIQRARDAFDRMMPNPSLVTWNTMITNYAQHGKAKEAMKLWWDMEHKSIVPSHITFLGVLAACGHVGLMEEGKTYYLSIMSVDSHHPMAEHLVCMVGMLGRAGQLERIEELVQRIFYEPMAIMAWRTLLRVCVFHGDLSLLSFVIGNLESNLVSYRSM